MGQQGWRDTSRLLREAGYRQVLATHINRVVVPD